MYVDVVLFVVVCMRGCVMVCWVVCVWCVCGVCGYFCCVCGGMCCVCGDVCVLYIVMCGG